MLITLSSFTLMAVAIKELTAASATNSMEAAGIIFFRSLINLLILLPILFYSGIHQLKTSSVGKHFFRSLFHFFGQFGWIFGISLLPLAQVFALEFTVPIWTVIIASLFLNEAVTKHRIFAVVLGSIGVLVILRPTTQIIHPAAFAVLGGAIGYAISHVFTKSLVSNNSPLVVVFYMALFQLPMGFLASFNHWVMPEGIMWFWLLIISITALSGHYCISKAMTFADAMVVMPMDFLRLPLIMVVGLVLYNEQIEWTVLLGALLMFAGILLNLKNEIKTPTISKEKTNNET